MMSCCQTHMESKDDGQNCQSHRTDVMDTQTSAKIPVSTIAVHSNGKTRPSIPFCPPKNHSPIIPQSTTAAPRFKLSKLATAPPRSSLLAMSSSWL